MILSPTKNRKTTLALSLLLLTMSNAGANIARNDIDFTDYMSFANNFGKYTAGATNTIVYKTDGSLSGIIATPIPQFTDLVELYTGSAGLYGNNQYAMSAAHVGNPNLVFNRRYSRPDVNLFQDYNKFNENAQVKDRFNPSEYNTSNFVKNGYKDIQILRSSKLVYDAIPHPAVTDNDFTSLVHVGSYVARVGQGLNAVGYDDHKVLLGLKGGQAFAGGTNVIQYFYPTANGITNPEHKPTTNNNQQDPLIYGPVLSLQKNQQTALDASSEPNDSGSPVLVWDKTTKTWLSLGVNHGGSDHNTNGYGKTSELRASPMFADQVMSQFNKTITNQTVSVAQNGSNISVNDHTYNANGSNSDNLNFTADNTVITIQNKVNAGWGAFTFSENATVNGSTADSQLLGAGIIVAPGKTVNYNLDLGTDNNLIKLGNGTLVINGNGKAQQAINANTVLSVGDGVVVLNSTHASPLASNIRIATGRATVKLNQDHQINGDNVSFGVKGGKLDLNGHNVSFGEIYHLDNGATITNSNNTNKSTFTFTNSENRTFLGNFTGNLDVNYAPSSATTNNVWDLRSPQTNSTGNLTISGGQVRMAGDSVVIGSNNFKSVVANINRSANFSFNNVNVEANTILQLGRAAHLDANVNVKDQAKLNILATGKVLDDYDPWYLGQGRDWQVPINTITLNKTINFTSSSEPTLKTFSATTTAQDLTAQNLPTSANTNFNVDLENNHKAVINSTITGHLNLVKTGTGEANFTGNTAQAYGIVNFNQGILRFNQASDLTNLAIYSNNSANILGINQELNTVNADTNEKDVDTYKSEQTQANTNLSLILNNLNPNFTGSLSVNGEVTGLSSTNQSDNNNIVATLNQHPNLYLGTHRQLDLGNKYDTTSVLNTSLTTLNLGGDAGHINVYGLANDQADTHRTINIGNNQFSQGSVALHGISASNRNLVVNVKGLTNLDIIDSNLGVNQDLSAQVSDSKDDKTTELEDIKHPAGYSRFVNLGYGSSVNYKLSDLTSTSSTGFLLIGPYAQNLANITTLDSSSPQAQALAATIQKDLKVNPNTATTGTVADKNNAQTVALAPVEASLHTYHLNHLDLSHTNLAIGASKYQTVIIENLTPNLNQDYNFSGAGTIIVERALDSNARNLNVDAQYHQGGKVVLNHSNILFNGQIHVAGNTMTTIPADIDNTQQPTGSIALVQGANKAFGLTSQVSLGHGGVLNINGFDTSLKLGQNDADTAITAYSNTTQINPYKTSATKPNLTLVNDQDSHVDINTQLVGNMDVHFTNGAHYNLVHNQTQFTGDYYVDNSELIYAGAVGEVDAPSATSNIYLQNSSVLTLNASSIGFGSKLVVESFNPADTGKDSSYVNVTRTAPGQMISNIDMHSNLTITGADANDPNTLKIGNTNLSHNNLTINNLNFTGLNIVGTNNNPEEQATLVLSNSSFSTAGSNNTFFSNTKFKEVVINNSTIHFNNYSYKATGQKYDPITSGLTNITIKGHSTFDSNFAAEFYENVQLEHDSILTLSGNTEKVTSNYLPHGAIALNFNLSGDGTVNFNMTDKSAGQDIYNNFENFTGTLDVSQPLYQDSTSGAEYVGLNFTHWNGNTTLNFDLAGNKTAVVKNVSQKFIYLPNGKTRLDRSGGKIITLTNLTNYHGTLVADEGNFIFQGQNALAGDFTVQLRQGDFLVDAKDDQRAVTGHLNVSSTNQFNYPVINITKTGNGTVELANGIELHNIVNANITQGTLAVNATTSDRLFHQNFTYTVAKDANLEIHADTDLNFVSRNVGQGSLVINQTNNHTVNINLHDLNLTGETITIANGTLNQILTDNTVTASRKLAGTGTWELSQGKLVDIQPTATPTITKASITTTDITEDNNEKAQAPATSLDPLYCGVDEYNIKQRCNDEQLFGQHDSKADPTTYHLNGYGDSGLDSNYRVVTIDQAGILSNFNGNILFNQNTQLDFNYVNANLNHIKLESVANTNRHTIHNLNSTTLHIGNITDYHGQLIAQNGDISLNGAKALQSPALISASDGHKIILNASANNNAVINSNQLHIDSKTVTKTGASDLNFNTDKPIFTNLTALHVEQGNISFNHNIFADNKGVVTLNNSNINFNLDPTDNKAQPNLDPQATPTEQADSSPLLLGNFTGNGNLTLNRSAQLHSSQLGTQVNLGVYDGNYQLILDPSIAEHSPNISGNGNLSLVTANHQQLATLTIKNNLDHFTGTLNLARDVTLDLQTADNTIKIGGQGTISTNFGDQKETGSDEVSKSDHGNLDPNDENLYSDLVASNRNILLVAASNVPIVTTSSSGTPSIGGGDNRKSVSLDLTTDHPDFTGTIDAKNGDVVIVGEYTPTAAKYNLAGSRIILNDKDTKDLDLSKYNFTNSKPNVDTSAVVNNVDRNIIINENTAKNINNIEINKGNMITQSSISLNHVINKGFINIGDNSINFNSYDDNNGTGIIGINLTGTDLSAKNQPRIVVLPNFNKDDNSKPQVSAPDLNNNSVHLKLLGNYKDFISKLKNNELPIVKTTGKLKIINLGDVNNGSIYHLIVKDDGSINSLTTDYGTKPQPQPGDHTTTKPQDQNKPNSNPESGTSSHPDTTVNNAGNSQDNNHHSSNSDSNSSNDSTNNSTNNNTNSANNPNSSSNQDSTNPNNPNISNSKPSNTTTNKDQSYPNDNQTNPSTSHTYVVQRVVSEQALAIFRQVSTIQTISLTNNVGSEFKDTVGVRTLYSQLSDLDYKSYSQDNAATEYKNSSSVVGWGFEAGKVINVNNVSVNPMVDIKYANINTTADVKHSDGKAKLDSSLLATKFKLNFQVHDFKVKTYVGYDYASFTTANHSSANLSMLNTLFSLAYDSHFNLNNGIGFMITNEIGLNYQPIISNNLSQIDSAVTDLTNDSPVSFFYNVNLGFKFNQWTLDLGGQLRYSPSKVTLHSSTDNITSELESNISFLLQGTIGYQITNNFSINGQVQLNNYYSSLNLDTKLGVNFSW